MCGMQPDQAGESSALRLATLSVWVSQMFAVSCLEKLPTGVFFQISAETIYESRGTGHC